MTGINTSVEAFNQGDGAEAANVTSISTVCLWCGHPFQARRGGSPKRFCSAAHRVSFWSALRRWAARAVAAGALTVDQIRSGDPAACTLVASGSSPALVSEPRKRAPVAPAAASPD